MSEIYLPYLLACLQILLFLHLDMLIWNYAVFLYQSNEAFQLSLGKPTPTMNSIHLVTRRKPQKVATISFSCSNKVGGVGVNKGYTDMQCLKCWNPEIQLLRIKDNHWKKEDQTLLSTETHAKCLSVSVPNDNHPSFISIWNECLTQPLI